AGAGGGGAGGRPAGQGCLREHGLHPPQGVRPVGGRGKAGRDEAAARAAGARDDPRGTDSFLTARPGRELRAAARSQQVLHWGLSRPTAAAKTAPDPVGAALLAVGYLTS